MSIALGSQSSRHSISTWTHSGCRRRYNNVHYTNFFYTAFTNLGLENSSTCITLASSNGYIHFLYFICDNMWIAAKIDGNALLWAFTASYSYRCLTYYTTFNAPFYLWPRNTGRGSAESPALEDSYSGASYGKSPAVATCRIGSKGHSTTRWW